jgi:hypothetical protein
MRDMMDVAPEAEMKKLLMLLGKGEKSPIDPKLMRRLKAFQMEQEGFGSGEQGADLQAIAKQLSEVLGKSQGIAKDSAKPVGLALEQSRVEIEPGAEGSDKERFKSMLEGDSRDRPKRGKVTIQDIQEMMDRDREASNDLENEAFYKMFEQEHKRDIEKKKKYHEEMRKSKGIY